MNKFNYRSFSALILAMFSVLTFSNCVDARSEEGTKLATFAGGCFWCVESAFDHVDGVVRAVSGYTGGSFVDPTYKDVSHGKTDHVEAVQIVFRPEEISYDELLNIFWRQINPTDDGGQFADRGKHYRTAIYTHDEEQRAAADASKATLIESGRFEGTIVTQILDVGNFYPAEEYHQDYASKNPQAYKRYRDGSGRTGYLLSIWGAEDPTHAMPETFVKPDDATLRQQLTPLQYRVTQEEGTERPFENEFWDNKRAGLYVDRVSGEPLFSSVDKFRSGTGWPSFTRPLEPANLIELEDSRLGTKRVEIRSRGADSHLGHLFPDGPLPTGDRYCINSAALKFVPLKELEAEGYGEFLSLFNQ